MNQTSSASRRLLAAMLTPRHCRIGALLFFAAMVLAGAIPGQAEALSSLIWDKLLHFVAYSLLSALVYGALAGGPMRRALLTVAIVALLGACDEGLQAQLSYRNANLLDWQIDMLAACVTVTLLWSLQAARLALNTR